MPTSPPPAHILIVEDNRTIARLYGLLLLLEGYTVTVAHTGMRGIRLAQTTHPAVIVWDVNLPDANDAWWMVPELPPGVPLIIATAERGIVVPPGAILLEKPVEADLFLATILKVLTR